MILFDNISCFCVAFFIRHNIQMIKNPTKISFTEIILAGFNIIELKTGFASEKLPVVIRYTVNIRSVTFRMYNKTSFIAAFRYSVLMKTISSRMKCLATK